MNSKIWREKIKMFSYKEIHWCYLNLIPHHTLILTHLLCTLDWTNWVFFVKKVMGKFIKILIKFCKRHLLPFEVAPKIRGRGRNLVVNKGSFQRNLKDSWSIGCYYSQIFYCLWIEWMNTVWEWKSVSQKYQVWTKNILVSDDPH